MSEEKNTDVLDLKTGFESRNTVDEDSVFAQRNIKAAPVLHTKAEEETQIPISREKTEELLQAPVTGRFIKTSVTPHVSTVLPVKEEEELTAVDKFSDRLASRAPHIKEHTGYTGKLNTYAVAHATAENSDRMIISDEKSTVPVQAAVSAEEKKPKKTDNAGEDAAFNILNSVSEITTDEANKLEIKKTMVNVETDEDMKIADPKALFAEKGNKDNGKKTKQNEATKAIDGKGSLLRRLAGAAQEGVRRNPDQMMLESNKDEQPITEVIDEDSNYLEDELEKTRSKRKDDYHVWDKKQEAKDDVDEKFSEADVAGSSKVKMPDFLQKILRRFENKDVRFNPVKSEEYTDYNDRKKVSAAIADMRKATLLRTFIVGVLGFVLLIFDIVAAVSASSEPNGVFSILGGNYIVYNTVNLIFLLGATVMMLTDLKNGFFSLMKMHPKTDTSLLLLTATAFLQTVLSYFSRLKTEYDYHLLAPAAILMCVPFLLSKIFYYDNMRQCFKSVAAKSDKSYLRKVSDPALVSELVRDDKTKEHKAVYAGKTRFITRFIERSSDAAFAGMPSSRTVLICAGLSFLVGVLALVFSRSPVTALSVMGFALAVSFPVSCLMATGVLIVSENRRLSLKSSFVLSFADARDFAVVDDVVISANDIIRAEVTGCITSKKVSQKQAEFCAAALAGSFSCPLADALKNKTEVMEEKFPNVENPIYEDKLGFSAWISGCRVLLGSHALLENHNVAVPEESAVLKFLKEGETPVYLALEGNFAAVLGVTYSACEEIQDNLYELVKRGANILVESCDFAVSDLFAEKLLGLPGGSVRIINHQTAQKLSATKEDVSVGEDAGIVFGESFDCMCRCAAAAVRLDRAKRTAKIICDVGAYVGLALTLLLTLTKANAVICGWFAVLLQLVWIVICFAVAVVSPSNVAEKINNTKNAIGNVKKPSVKAPEVENAVLQEQVEPPRRKTPAEEWEGGTFVPPPTEEPVLDKKTFDTLNAMAGQEQAPGVSGKSRKAGLRDLLQPSDDETDENEQEDSYDDEDDEMPDLVKNVTAGVGKLLNRLTGKTELSQDIEQGKQKTSDSGISALPAKQRLSDIEKLGQKRFAKQKSKSAGATDAQLSDEEQTRRRFTPPEIPDAPYFDLSSKKEKQNDPLEARFVPPALSQTRFSDSDFSRFEDDKIFASLEEDRKNR